MIFVMILPQLKLELKYISQLEATPITASEEVRASNGAFKLAIEPAVAAFIFVSKSVNNFRTVSIP